MPLLGCHSSSLAGQKNPTKLFASTLLNPFMLFGVYAGVISWTNSEATSFCRQAVSVLPMIL